MTVERLSIEQLRKKESKRALERDVVYGIRKVTKGARGMPRLLEAKKDVTSCDKPGVTANKC